MAKDPAAAPDPAVIDALNAVYRPVIRSHEQFHEQESVFGVRYGYKGLKQKYQHLVDASHCWRHDLLRRVIRLGGEPDSRIGVKIDDDAMKAFENAHDILDEIYAAIDAAVKVVQDSGDHPTFKVLMALQHHVDCKRAMVEKQMRQINDIGKDYLIAAIK